MGGAELPLVDFPLNESKDFVLELKDLKTKGKPSKMPPNLGTIYLSVTRVFDAGKNVCDCLLLLFSLCCFVLSLPLLFVFFLLFLVVSLCSSLPSHLLLMLVSSLFSLSLLRVPALLRPLVLLTVLLCFTCCLQSLSVSQFFSLNNFASFLHTTTTTQTGCWKAQSWESERQPHRVRRSHSSQRPCGQDLLHLSRR